MDQIKRGRGQHGPIKYFTEEERKVSRRIPGHIREFNWPEPHLDNEMVFKTWQN